VMFLVGEHGVEEQEEEEGRGFGYFE
jgi:hypothetical protein